MITGRDLSIDAERLTQRHFALAQIGATPTGGVRRLALDTADIEAHGLIADWARARNLRLAIDAIGNMFITRLGRYPDLPPVASGSHVDSQPTAGHFDGPVGVLAAFEALETIDDAGLETERSIEVIVWNNEEGARYLPACLGSAVHAGRLSLDEMRAQADADGITLGDCVDRLKAGLPDAADRALGSPLSAFLEAHIEQGTILETSGNVIGLVTGMQGYRRYTVRVTGVSAHSGATPLSRRKDAFVAATQMVTALQHEISDTTDTVRFTISRFEIVKPATSLVPSEVVFGIDLRHPDAETLAAFGKSIAEVCIANRGSCDVTVTEINHQPPLAFDSDLLDRLCTACDRRQVAHQPILSAAGHDARHAAALGPSAMVFIPCRDGISHNEAEYAEMAHIAAASQVICDAIVGLAGQA